MVIWWVVPGLALIAASVVLILVRLVLALAHRPHLHLALLTVQLRQTGMGLMLLGLGASLLVPALFNGPDLGQLVAGGLIAGMGGLYFIAVHSLFKSGGPMGVPPSTAGPWDQRKNEPPSRGVK